ncbi:Dps family protein [Xanthomonas sp. 60]
MAKTKNPAKNPPKAPKVPAVSDKPSMQTLADAAPSAPGIDIGIKEGERKKIADGLSRYQADAFTLYLKTHNFHWNVTGSMFNSLHTMFETQYTEQWAALDEVAERIRALGFNAPGSYREFAALTSIPEEEGLSDSADWREMVRQLVVANEAVCRTARQVLDVADDADDAPTEDLMTQRLQTHEKYAWMLRSLLQ